MHLLHSLKHVHCARRLLSNKALTNSLTTSTSDWGFSGTEVFRHFTSHVESSLLAPLASRPSSAFAGGCGGSNRNVLSASRGVSERSDLTLQDDRLLQSIRSQDLSRPSNGLPSAGHQRGRNAPDLGHRSQRSATQKDMAR